MGNNLSDELERFISDLINLSETPVVRISRKELAESFGCAPSQINYVINTRFQRVHGYLVESKRGGGGYIVIRQVQRADESHSLLFAIIDHIGDTLTQHGARHVLKTLRDADEIDNTLLRVMSAAVSDNSLAPVEPSGKDRLRAHILKGMLLSLKTDSVS
ncbi:MAG: CtsR family transcriptional regulator [Clostridia bacterium]|nr:CtsR family transcriptional regulator [Clostridia bacterium]